ncbi:MAG TPA: peptide-methionine (R)-S-oxide reductase [Caldithrix abyssi]|uniref:peptide-methionine (R)-S-oxide reductase n=1 Tax=Caldithrix abyssi TaxID=187145 RepID=A0A7V1LP28_CALAY|nr:peptide-methionine (R)-S-oxide reductase [Caldithrix abyssi]
MAGKKLTPQQENILFNKGTEPPFSGAYYHNTEKGTYHCASCGQALFSSDAKYDSGSGWPSFFKPLSGEAVATAEDRSHGMRRVEVLCPHCGGHLGHLFPDGPQPTGLRYCINSLSLEFKKKES